MATTSGVASISFAATTGEEFLHLDLLPSNEVRIDDIGPVFGSFPREQPFMVQVTLNITASGSTAQIVLSGGASGHLDYTVHLPFLARQFGAIRVWQGFPHMGAFKATNITVTRAT